MLMVPYCLFMFYKFSDLKCDISGFDTNQNHFKCEIKQDINRSLKNINKKIFYLKLSF